MNTQISNMVIRKAGYFHALMEFPERLLDAIHGYFTSLTLVSASDNQYHSAEDSSQFPGAETASASSLPTIPGLISWLGAGRVEFNNIRVGRPNKKFHEDSVYYIQQACLCIENYVVQSGMTGTVKAAFAKFLLSAYNDASEKTVSEQTVQHNHLHIELSSPDEIKLGLGEQFRRESLAIEGRTSSLCNRRIDIGEIAEASRARKSSTTDEPTEDGSIDVEWSLSTPEDDNNSNDNEFNLDDII